jgi:hypothetical protein
LTTINIRSKTLSTPIIVDGIGRTGKFFLCNILCGLENIEYFQYVSVLEHIPYLHRLGCIKEDAAISLLQVNVDEHAYNMMVGRNINLRYDDGSSVMNSFESELYNQRANTPVDNDAIINNNHANIRLSPFITHETFPNIKIFYKAFPTIKIVLLKRHPVDVVHSWFLRGWGKRFEQSDLLAFIPLVKNNELQFPWYVNGWEEEYYNISEIDRIIKGIDKLMKMEEDTFKSLDKDQQKKVLIIYYENLVEKTEKEVSRLEYFLDNKSSVRMPNIMQYEKCPKNFPLKNRTKKMLDITNRASKKYIDLLLARVDAYESDSAIL